MKTKSTKRRNRHLRMLQYEVEQLDKAVSCWGLENGQPFFFEHCVGLIGHILLRLGELEEDERLLRNEHEDV